MASLILLGSELVRNHKRGAAALLAAYPPSSFSSKTSSCVASAVRKPVKDEGSMKKQNSQRTEETVMENPLESRVCVDFVWP